MEEKNYRVLRIEEQLYGCEELPEGQPVLCDVLLEAADGTQRAKSSGPAASASMRSCTLPCPAPPTPPGPLQRPLAFLPGVSPGSGSSALAATRARPGTARSSAFPRPTLPTATPAARA